MRPPFGRFEGRPEYLAVDGPSESGAFIFAGAETKDLVVPVKVGLPPAKAFQGWTKLIVSGAINSHAAAQTVSEMVPSATLRRST